MPQSGRRLMSAGAPGRGLASYYYGASSGRRLQTVGRSLSYYYSGSSVSSPPACLALLAPRLCWLHSLCRLLRWASSAGVLLLNGRRASRALPACLAAWQGPHRGNQADIPPPFRPACAGRPPPAVCLPGPPPVVLLRQQHSAPAGRPRGPRPHVVLRLVPPQPVGGASRRRPRAAPPMRLTGARRGRRGPRPDSEIWAPPTNPPSNLWLSSPLPLLCSCVHYS